MKAIMFFTVIAILSFGGVLLLSDPSSKAQLPPENTTSAIEKKFDTQLDRVEEKLDDLEKVPPKTVVKIRYRTRKVFIPIVDSIKAVTLQIQGEEYEVEPEILNGRILINVDSVQQKIIENEMEQATLMSDTLTQSIMEEANGRIKVWQSIKSFFKRKN